MIVAIIGVELPALPFRLELRCFLAFFQAIPYWTGLGSHLVVRQREVPKQSRKESGLEGFTCFSRAVGEPPVKPPPLDMSRKPPAETPPSPRGPPSPIRYERTTPTRNGQSPPRSPGRTSPFVPGLPQGPEVTFGEPVTPTRQRLLVPGGVERAQNQIGSLARKSGENLRALAEEVGPLAGRYLIMRRKEDTFSSFTHSLNNIIT